MPKHRDPCPMCCYSDNLPPLRSPIARQLVAEWRMQELMALAGHHAGIGAGYVVLLEDPVLGEIAIAQVDTPAAVRVISASEHEQITGTRLPISGASQKLAGLELVGKRLLNFALTEHEPLDKP